MENIRVFQKYLYYIIPAIIILFIIYYLIANYTNAIEGAQLLKDPAKMQQDILNGAQTAAQQQLITDATKAQQDILTVNTTIVPQIDAKIQPLYALLFQQITLEEKKIISLQKQMQDFLADPNWTPKGVSRKTYQQNLQGQIDTKNAAIMDLLSTSSANASAATQYTDLANLLNAKSDLQDSLDKANALLIDLKNAQSMYST